MRLHDAGGVGAIALARTRKQAGMIGCGGAHQRGDVVGQNLGRHVDDQGRLRQPRDGFEVQHVLDQLEGFLDSPTLVIQVTNIAAGQCWASMLVASKRIWPLVAIWRTRRNEGA